MAVSALAHVVALALLGLSSQAPRPALRDEAAVTPVEIWTPPPAVAARRSPAAAVPSPLRPRQARAPTPSPVVAPLPLAPPQGPAPPARRPDGVGATAPVTAAGGDLRRALRGSTVGCANRDTVGLTLRERENCDDSYAKGRENDPFIQPPMDPGKRAAWDAESARRERARKRKEAPPPPGVNPADNAGGTRTNGLGILGY